MIKNQTNKIYNIQLGVDFAVDNFAECPPYMRETYHELAEAVNMPRLAHPDNCMWPSSQVNMAVPQRYESGKLITIPEVRRYHSYEEPNETP